ncbi:MAG: hypothetical protein V8T07_08660 [Muribaculaceae bacterium]|nr:hypothetical protein [Prevotella sp.]
MNGGSRMMMTYGNIYVATVALGANYSQIITAMREAEAYPGPSIIVAYCPCINHGIRGRHVAFHSRGTRCRPRRLLASGAL